MPKHPSLLSDTTELSWFERNVGFKGRYFLLALIGVIMAGVHIHYMLFGNASVKVLLEVEEYENQLKQEIKRLKQENATLQKDYFELKELQPSVEAE